MRARQAFWIFLLVFPASVAAQAADSATTVFIVRHAEKDTAKDDPALTPRGQARANALVHLLSATPVGGVIASDRRRTLETAAPEARARGISVDTLPREGTVEEYAGRIATRISSYKGKALLVVSHSDVIPTLLKTLGIGEPIDIPDDVYDDLFIITLPAGGHPSLCRLKYGAPSP